MATRSTISIELPTKEVKTIYVHYDGYLDGVGDTLLNAFNTEDKVNQIINLGNLSALFSQLKPRYTIGKKQTPHTFDTPQKMVTVAYGRDRGDTGCEAVTYSSFKEAQKEQFNYLFKGGKWYVQPEIFSSEKGFSYPKPVLLTQKLIDLAVA